MDSSWIAGIAVVINLIVIIVGGVWTVSHIGTQTAVLDAHLSHLSAAIDRLATTISRLDGKCDDHETRIAVLESQEKQRQNNSS